MASDSKIHTCEHCDYTSQWKCNVTRHMVRKHSNAENENVSQMLSLDVPNVVAHVPNVVAHVPNVVVLQNNNISEINLDTNGILCKTCEKCNKLFSRRDKMLKHTTICKGIINTLSCEYCSKTFASRYTKSHHLRLCKAKKEVDMCALVVHDPQNTVESAHEEPQEPQEPQEPTVQNITNNTINNTINNNGTINNNNTVIQNIIVYNANSMELLNDHITKSELRKMVNSLDFPKVLTDYSTALLSRRENQCVRKTNLRSTSSAIHVGDDKWIYQSDKEVLPKLLSHIATNLGNIQHEYKIKIMAELDTFIIDVQSEAIDCHENAAEEARLKVLFKRTLTNVKHLLFNLTKQTIAEKRKQTDVT